MLKFNLILKWLLIFFISYFALIGAVNANSAVDHTKCPTSTYLAYGSNCSMTNTLSNPASNSVIDMVNKITTHILPPCNCCYAGYNFAYGKWWCVSAPR